MKTIRILGLLLAAVLMLLTAACTDNTGGTATNPPAAQTSGATTAATAASTATPEPELINKTGVPVANELLTFTAMAKREATTADWNGMWCFEKFAEITNIAFDIESIDAEAWTEKVNLAFATQSLPEVFFTSQAISAQDMINYGNQGLLLPLEGYLDDYGTLILEDFGKYPAIKGSLVSPDGHMYEIRGFNMFNRELNKKRFWINAQWVDNLGLSIPANLDEFYDLMVAIKDGDPNGNGDTTDEIPVAGMFNTYQGMDIPLLVAFGYTSTRVDTTADGTVVYVPTEANYLEYLKYFNKLYNDGLVDPEYFSQTTEQFLAKGAGVVYGAFCYSADWLMMPDEVNYAQYESIPPMVSEYNSTQMWPANNVSLSGGMSVTNKCAHPEAIVRFLDWLFTKDASNMAQFGPEDGTWEGGKGGWTLVTQNGVQGYEVTYPEKYSGYNEFRTQELTPMALPYVSLPDTQPIAEYYVALIPKQVKLTTDVVTNFAPYYKVDFPTVKMTAEESSEINEIQTDLKPYVDQMEARFMTGEESFDNFDAFIQGCKDRKCERLIAIYQQVYDRWMSD